MTSRSRPGVAIIHQGEDIPIDDGYVPLRYGRLAEDLTADGFDVMRISPSFRHSVRRDRIAGQYESSEGAHLVVPTRGYLDSRGLDRARFLVDFALGATRAVRQLGGRVNVVVVGVHPPGMVSALRLSGCNSPIIADVRDLWPEALAVGASPRLVTPLSLAGRLFSQELRLASAVTAVTEPMLRRTPTTDRRRAVIPLGLSMRSLDESELPPIHAPLQICFLSSHAQGYDFAPVIDGWNDYVASLPPSSGSPRFCFIGVEPHDAVQRARAVGDPTVELLGRVEPTEITRLLSAFDLGVAPARAEWAHSAGNKIFDYLSSGLFVVHSIERGAVAVLEEPSLARVCPLDACSWAETFAEIHRVRQNLRAQREQRMVRADQLVGRAATAAAFNEMIDSVLRQRR